MSDHERYGFRDATYSVWHRPPSVERFTDPETAKALGQIDIDGTVWSEFDRYNSKPYALIETARDVGQKDKCAEVTRNLGKLSGLPAVVLLYTPSDMPNPTKPQLSDISRFRYQRLWPETLYVWNEISPQEWVELLEKIRAYGKRRWKQFNSFAQCPVCDGDLLEQVGGRYVHQWCPTPGHYDNWRAFDGLRLSDTDSPLFS